ncbi:MAG: hypothetical protein KA743_07755 [Geothrix sp.]|nr:hypothetical protein [Geothrix sp.]
MNRALLALLFAAASVAALAQTKPAPAPATKPATKPAAPAAKPAGAILANKDSKTYHRPDCKVAAKMKAANQTSFATAAEADKAGYKACKVCKP